MRATTPLLLAVLLLAACNGSRDELLADLQSTRPEKRAIAVKKLAEMGKEDDLVLFTRAAKDSAPLVRSEAAVALGESQDPRVVDLLGDLLGDSDESVQAKAAAALAQIKSDKAKSYLTIQYSRRGRATRQAIVEALSAANVPGAMAAVVAAESKTLWERNLTALNDGSLPERVAAAEELGKSGRVEAVNRLILLVKDSQVILAAAAVRGLGYTGDQRAVQPISELLSEKFPELREAAVEALVRLADPKALPALKDMALEQSAASSVATHAIISLPASAETNAALCQIALFAAPEEALEAGQAMRARGGCPLETIVERLGKKPEQLAALHSLEGLGPVAASTAAKVIPFLSSADEALRLQAIRTAAALKDPASIEPIRKIFDQEVKRIEQLRADWVKSPLPHEFKPGYDPGGATGSDANAAAQKLRQDDLFKKIRAANEAKLKAAGKSALLRVVPPQELVDDTSEEQLELLSATLRALGDLGAPGATELLTPFTVDASPTLRASAFYGLSQLGPDGIAHAKEGLLDPVREVQTEVAQSLASQGEQGQGAIADILPKLAADRFPLLIALDRANPKPVTTEALIGILKEGGAESALAAQLLGRVKAASAVEPLMRALDDQTSVARRDALVALGRIGDPKAAEVVAKDLNHESPEVRAAAAEALTTLGLHVRADALDALKGDYYRKVREAAEQALAKVGGT